MSSLPTSDDIIVFSKCAILDALKSPVCRIFVVVVDVDGTWKWNSTAPGQLYLLVTGFQEYLLIRINKRDCDAFNYHGLFHWHFDNQFSWNLQLLNDQVSCHARTVNLAMECRFQTAVMISMKVGQKVGGDAGYRSKRECIDCKGCSYRSDTFIGRY